MGIRVKNLHDYTIHLRVPGKATAAADKDCAMVPFDGFISNVAASCVAATGASHSIIDVNYMGTTIFSAATKITVSTITGVASYSVLSSTPFSVTAGSILSLDTDVVSTTLSNLCVDVKISRTPIYDASNVLNQDQTF